MAGELTKVWALFTPAEKRKAHRMLLLVLLMAFVDTIGVLSVMPFLSVLGRPEIVMEHRGLHAAYEALAFENTRRFMIALGLASITIVVFSSAFKIITQHSINRFIQLQRHSISSRLLARYLRQPYTFFLTRNTADLNKNILSETDQLLFNLVQPLAQMLAQGSVVLAMIVIIVAYDPLMALFIVAVVGSLYAAIYGLVRRRLVRMGTERVAANRDRYQTSSEALAGIRDVKVTNSEAAYMQRFNSASRNYSRHLAANDTLSQAPLYLVEAAGYGGLIIIALALLLQSNDISQVLPALGLYGFAAYRILPAAQIMYRGFAKLQFSSPALNTIHRDLALPEEASRSATGMIAPNKQIQLEGIRFAYPTTPQTAIFDGFSLTIPVNTNVAITGKSGAGKSTLMDLLLGLLHPQEGILRVDETVIDASNVAIWQRAIGYVPQHIFLSDASVAENIAFGVRPDSIDMQAVQRAARAAQIHDFIYDELPQAYDTFIGERGIRLSGGQRQRIGIARALYLDPPVLFFDEASSSLDPETTKSISYSIRQTYNQKTIVSISHQEHISNHFHVVISL